MKRVYLDYASLTPIDRRVLREMKRYSSAEYSNPSSLYKEGVAAKKALEDGRTRIGAFIHAHPDEIVFTSGGTEANNLVIEGVLKAAHKNGITRPHLIISNIEHSSVMEDVVVAEHVGVEVTRLAVDSNGLISLDELKKAIKPNTALVSIMTVNNEIGTIQPIREIVKVIRHWRRESESRSGDKNQEPSSKNQTRPKSQIPNSNISIPNSRSFNYPLFHTDAAQAAIYEDLNVEKLGVDLLTIDSSKAYGPRGIGALFVRRGTPVEPIIHGGGQERGLRSGTENLPAIMGFAKALEVASIGRDKESIRISQLRGYFLKGLLKIRPDIIVNPKIQISHYHDRKEARANQLTAEAGFQSSAGGEHPPMSLLKSVESFDTSSKAAWGRSVTQPTPQNNLSSGNQSAILLRESSVVQSPHILNISIHGIGNELFVLRLDAHGVACSTKSSCLRDADESYVLRAIGADSKSSIRFSFGRATKKADLDKALAVIAKALKV